MDQLAPRPDTNVAAAGDRPAGLGPPLSRRVHGGHAPRPKEVAPSSSGSRGAGPHPGRDGKGAPFKVITTTANVNDATSGGSGSARFGIVTSGGFLFLTCTAALPAMSYTLGVYIRCIHGV
ncbi:hypothetical protein GCM10010270_26670 [Streptomyces violaceus]|nr:hypothetical protein GCM10010270_26670 [Streptomyces janthinus]